MLTMDEYLHSKASKNRIPLSGTFELSPVCNFACKMCYVRRTPAQIRAEGKSLKTWQQWLALARECHKAGTLYLLLTGGEPFLYPGFRELYEGLHEMGFVLSINSNGTMIDEETVAWLKKHAPSRVNVTLYGASAETYRAICGQADGFDRALRAIRLLTEAGIPVVINASMIPENHHDLENIVAIGKQFGINTRVATYMFPPARREREETDSRFSPEMAAQMFLRKAKCMLSAEEYRKLISAPYGTRKAQEDWGDHPEEFMRCRAGRCGWWISWDGVMTACGMTRFPLAQSPFEDGFLESWQRLTQCVRTTQVMKGCEGCTMKSACRPCVAMLDAEVGDANQKAPYLCEMTKCLIAQMEREMEDLRHEQG